MAQHAVQIPGVKILSTLIEPGLQHQRRNLHDAVAEEVAVPDLLPACQQFTLIPELAVFGVVCVNILAVFENGKVRNLRIAGIGRMTDCHLISRFAEEDRQKLQGLVVLGGEGLGRSFVELFRSVLISTEERRGPGVGGASEGQRIGVPGEAVKLLLQLRLFLKEIRNITADAAVEHEDNHILSVPAEGEGGLLAGFPFGQLPDLRQVGPDSDNIVDGHP